MALKPVAFAPANRDACALWRMFMPHLHTPGSKYLMSDGPMPIDEYANVKVAVVQRLCTKDNYAAIQIMRKMNIKVVYDLDDNLWDVPKSNPGWKILNYLHDGFTECAGISSVITVSTEALKVAVRKHLKELRGSGIEIVVIHNAVDFNLFAPAPKRENEFFRVGWAGTNTHSGDVRQVFNQLPALLQANPKIQLEFVGLPAPAIIQDHERVRQRDFVPVGEYPSRLPSWHWDIMLAPLEDNVFNRSKSNIKILEAAAIGTPILVSDFGSYREFCSRHKELDYLLCRKASDWTTKILLLASEPEYGEYLAGIMLSVAKQEFDIASTVGNTWHAVFES